MKRLPIAALVLSASTLVGLAIHEGYRGTAYIPVPGDVPTIGFGETKGVKHGDSTDPVRAIIRLQQSADEYAMAVKRCAPVPMYQHEFDAYVSLTYNIGPGKVGKDGFCINKQGKTAIIPRRLAAGDYKGACEAILMYGNFKGKPLAGLAKRRQAEYRMCTGQA
jgi:lysozyme